MSRRCLRSFSLAPVALLFAVSTTAQQPPYAGREARPIKALSADEIAAYLAGEGMGLALAAELNGYPGPRHVLDLADSLVLSDTQRAAVQGMFDAMLVEARRLGAAIVESERRLDDAFAEGSVDGRSLETVLGRIGALQAELRFTHLAAHLAVRDVLSPDQIDRYRRLRGYAAPADAGHVHHPSRRPAGHSQR